MFSKLKKWYEVLIRSGSILRSPILLAMRLYWGWLLFQAGLGKLQHIDPFATLLASLGFPLTYIQAYAAALSECSGGVCLMLGFASRLMAIPVIITMLVAYATAHRQSLLTLFSDPGLFIEQGPFLFLLTALLVFAFGPGKLSIDYLIQRLIFKKSEF